MFFNKLFNFCDQLNHCRFLLLLLWILVNTKRTSEQEEEVNSEKQVCHTESWTKMNNNNMLKIWIPQPPGGRIQWCCFGFIFNSHQFAGSDKQNTSRIENIHRPDLDDLHFSKCWNYGWRWSKIWINLRDLDSKFNEFYSYWKCRIPLNFNQILKYYKRSSW